MHNILGLVLKFEEMLIVVLLYWFLLNHSMKWIIILCYGKLKVRWFRSMNWLNIILDVKLNCRVYLLVTY